jgi:hypothetical protein
MSGSILSGTIISTVVGKIKEIICLILFFIYYS